AAGQKKEPAAPGFRAAFTHGSLGWERGRPRLTVPTSHSGKNSAEPGLIPPPRLGPDGPDPKVKLGLNFAGLDTNNAGGIVEPPDPIAAAGPTAIVEIINSNIAFYDKASGRSLSSEGLDSFFARVDQADVLFSDVYVTYDEQAGRFFVSSMDIDFFNLVSYYDFAVSNHSDPTHGFSEMHQVDTTEVSPRTGDTRLTAFLRLGWNAAASFLVV